MKTEVSMEAAIAAVGQKTSLAGAGATGYAWLLSNEALGVMGVLIALAGLAVNWYFRRKEYELKKELNAAELAALKARASHE